MCMLWQKYQVYLNMECITEFLKKTPKIQHHFIANKMQIEIQHFSPSNSYSACLPDFRVPQNDRLMDGVCMYYTLSTWAQQAIPLTTY